MIYPRENNPINENDVSGKPLVRLYMSTPDDVPRLPGLDDVGPGSDVVCLKPLELYVLDGESGQWEVL